MDEDTHQKGQDVDLATNFAKAAGQQRQQSEPARPFNEHHTMLHILRNPTAFDADVVRSMQQQACYEIERLLAVETRAKSARQFLPQE